MFSVKVYFMNETVAYCGTFLTWWQTSEMHYWRCEYIYARYRQIEIIF